MGKRSTKRKDVCQVHSDHRQLPAGPAGPPPAGWRRLEDRGRWELEGGGQRDQGHPGVGRGEEGGGRVGGGSKGGSQPQVLQLRSSSSSRSPSAVERGGRRGCKDMLRQYRLN